MHPFKDSIQRANIFKTAYGKPDLLLHGLPPKSIVLSGGGSRTQLSLRQATQLTLRHGDLISKQGLPFPQFIIE